jgi:hypothetical protein
MNEFTYELIPADEATLTQASVKRTDANGVVTFIPVNPANSDYVAYLESLNDDTEAE